MLKQSLIYVGLSILVVLFARYFHLIVVYIDTAFTYVNIRISPIFSQTSLGMFIRQIIVLSILPVLLIGMPALAYRGLKGKQMPYFLEAVWISWLVIVLSNILIR